MNAPVFWSAGRRFLLWSAVFTMGILNLAAAEHHGQVKFGGLPVPGATVIAVQGGSKLSTITDMDGFYAFPDLSDGEWSIRVEMLGFEPSVRQVTVGAGAPPVEWELTILSFAEISKKAVAPQAAPGSPAGAANPATGAVSSRKEQNPSSKVEPGKTNQAVPGEQNLFPRTDLNAVNTDASVLGETERASGAFGGQTPEELAQRAADGLLINGSVNNSASSPFGQLPAFGNMRKGRGSLYNGSLGFILNNSAFDARPYSLTGQDMARPAYNRVTGLASFGGPLRIPFVAGNGPTIMLNYQWTRNRDITAQAGVMPTLAERNGDFSRSLNAVGQPVEIFDPFTGLQFPGNAIPLDRLSPQALSLLALYPNPTLSESTRYNYQIPISSVLHQDSFQARANKSVSRMNQLSGSFAWQSTRSDNPNLFGFLNKAASMGLTGSVNLRHSFTSRLLSNVGYQYSRFSARTRSFFEERRNISGEAGIEGNSQVPTDWGPPDLVFAGGVTTLSDGRPSSHHNQTSSGSFGMFWSRGRHNLSFGADFRRQQFNILSQLNPRGTFTFTGMATQGQVEGIPAAGTGSGFADFLLGVPDAVSLAFGNADKYFRASIYDAYITDDFRINPGLTLNAGIRWEYGSPVTEIYGRLVNLDITPGFAAAAPVVAHDPVGALTGTKYPDSLLRPDKTAFQPRLGFAWRPFPASSLVVRAGYGIYYNTSVYLSLATQMAQQAPLSKSLSVQNGPDFPLTLANAFNASPTGAATFAVDPDFQVGYAQNWQLSVQRDLPWALAMTAVYSGTQGTRGVQQFLPNTYPAGAAIPCPTCPSGFAYFASNGNSTRQAGQIQLRRRLRSGFTANVQYTWSKSIDNAALGGRGQGDAVVAQNWLDLSAERGLSNFDQRHLVEVQMQYSPGMGLFGGALMGGWKGTLLKEWTITSQITAGSGFPLTPVYLAAVNGTGVTGSVRPDATGANLYDAPEGLYLNPAAYAAPPYGAWGNAGRNSITGPVQFTWNASLGRTFPLKDRVILDLRIDASNVMNHVTWSGWNTTANSTQFGLPVAADPMRTLRITLRARM